MLCQPHKVAKVVGPRCDGTCCREFPLPWSHVEWAAILRGETDTVMDDEIAMIVSMVVPIPSTGNRYTCRLFDGKDCTAYEARPRMCSGYPYGKRCEHGKDCAWDRGRRGAHTWEDRQRFHLEVI